MDNFEKSIEATRSSFEKSFSEQAFYNRQTQDRNHLNSIIEILDLRPGMKVLDLGTGSGYIAFGIAGSHPDVSITGLDIVVDTLNTNRDKATEIGLKNMEFVSYDGIKFPFENEVFDIVVTRYALHHFPDIKGTFSEISRVLKGDGRVFVADPAPNDNDTEGFVDEYMQMKKDGHIKFYSENEFRMIGAAAGLHMISNNKTSIRFPKKRKDAAEFDSIVARHSKSVVNGYDLEVTEDEIYITEQVNNILFDKLDI